MTWVRLHESLRKIFLIISNVPPISELQHQGAVLNTKGVRQIIVGINYEQVGSGPVTPLKPCIKIDVILLLIVLSERRKE